jgi:hypothetical protein
MNKIRKDSELAIYIKQESIGLLNIPTAILMGEGCVMKRCCLGKRLSLMGRLF